MSWRTIFLSAPCSLRCAHGQLEHSRQENGQSVVRTFPFEDLSVVVADTPQITLTNAVLVQFAEHGILYVVCDGSHTPSGIASPFLRHVRAAEVGHAHMGATKPLCKRLWQSIIQQKIRNQAEHIALCGKEKKKIASLVGKVQSGDSGNVEAHAAALYFVALFGKSFHRDAELFINSCLDYGYAIVRSAVARHITASGLIPWLGLWHCNMRNAFNLADDVMEPFRPFVDYWVVHRVLPHVLEESGKSKVNATDSVGIKEMLQSLGEQELKELTLLPRYKALLVKSLDMQCGIARGHEHEQMAMLFAIERTVASLAKAILHKDEKLLQLPYFIP